MENRIATNQKVGSSNLSGRASFPVERHFFKADRASRVAVYRWFAVRGDAELSRPDPCCETPSHYSVLLARVRRSLELRERHEKDLS